MKAGYYVWIDAEERKVHISKKYEMIEEFDAQYNGRPYPHRWNIDLFEFQDRKDARQFQITVATKLAGDPKVNSRARNTSLFGLHGPIVGEF